MKNIAVFGSTGSIGTQTLEVVRANPEELKIVALAAHSNAKLLAAQIREFKPTLAVIFTAPASEELLTAAQTSGTELLTGEEGLLTAAVLPETDTLVAAISGYAGLASTFAAVRQKKNIALANKETLVAAGALLMQAVQENGVSLIPVDSEHSAVFQALCGCARPREEVQRLILTASGGPFYGCTQEQLNSVTVADCLRHPNWSMGRKITVDSATMANKGLEVIEAHWLFHLEYAKIDVVIHRQSIVHSLVEYTDGAVLAQLGLPDMRVPIQFALSYPERWQTNYGRLSLVEHSPLTFTQPDNDNFPLLKLAIECGRIGGTAPCAYNAANEVAVLAFLSGRIKFTAISEVVRRGVEDHAVFTHPSLEDIAAADAAVRLQTEKFLCRML